MSMNTIGTTQARQLAIEPLTAEAFAPYGQVIAAIEDGVPYGDGDAHLILDRGTPRFYVMRLDHRPWEVTRLTRHLQVTQCLASVGGKDWCIAVAPPAPEEAPEQRPHLETIKAFLIPGDTAIKLHLGAWHAGPYFDGDSLSFFNLESADTNIVDHDNLFLVDELGVSFAMSPPG